MKEIKISAHGGSAVVYAGQELGRYLRGMCPDAAVTEGEGGIALRVLDGAEAQSRFGIADPVLDDAFAVDIRNGRGEIIGSNGRSVLMGVYRLLELAGCRFFRPGREGEYISQVDMTAGQYAACEVAGHRHRGIVIEGANSVENILDMIEWMPKLGMNGYFMQFTTIHHFLERYYRHWNNPTRPEAPYQRERTLAYERLIQDAMRLRGLVLHGVGHGWVCGAMGVEGADWIPARDEPPADWVDLLALVAGKRGFHDSIPANTNLCYANAQARQRLVDYTVQYIVEHPELDYVHFWLADGSNNYCECDDCRALRPSDWYLRLLNDMDGRLTALGNRTRIVFLAYLDLLWPPERERLANPNRFTLMFAPITRPFANPLSAGTDARMQPYRYNEVALPRTPGENIAYLRAWQERVQVDSFDFDYYMSRAHFGDLGYMRVTQVIAEDVAQLRSLGLGGLYSCQGMRAFFPVALPNYMMGKKLWNPDTPTESIIAEYFGAAFGEGGEIARAYLTQVSALCDIDYWYAKRTYTGDWPGEKWRAIGGVAAEYAPRIEAQIPLHQGSRQLSWRYLHAHTRYATLLGNTLGAERDGDMETANRHFQALAAYITQQEDFLQPALDVYRVIELGKQRGLRPFAD